MDHGDADLPFLRPIIPRVRRQQIDDQQAAKKIAPGEDRQVDFPDMRMDDNETAKPAILGRVKPLVHLGKRAEENQREAECEQHHR